MVATLPKRKSSCLPGDTLWVCNAWPENEQNAMKRRNDCSGEKETRGRWEDGISQPAGMSILLSLVPLSTILIKFRYNTWYIILIKLGISQGMIYGKGIPSVLWEIMVGSGSYESTANRSGVIDCSSALTLVVYWEAFTNLSFFDHHGCVPGNVGTGEDRETGSVICGRIS